MMDVASATRVCTFAIVMPVVAVLEEIFCELHKGLHGVSWVDWGKVAVDTEVLMESEEELRPFEAHDSVGTM